MAGAVAHYYRELWITLGMWLLTFLSAMFFVKSPILLPLFATLNFVVCLYVKRSFPGWGLDIQSVVYSHSFDIVLAVSSWMAFCFWVTNAAESQEAI